MEREAAKFVRKNNIVMVNDFFVLITCEYYLHFNVKLPYPEIEFKKDNIKKNEFISWLYP